jgi:hypothetical protein
MLTSSGGLQQKSVASFVEEMGKAELEGEIHFLLVQVLGRSDSPGVRSRFVEVGGLDKLLRFLNEGSVRKLSNVVLWVLRVLEKLPFSNTLMNHPVARIGLNRKKEKVLPHVDIVVLFSQFEQSA